MATRVADQLVELIRREGPITFDRYAEVALYGTDGFFSGGHGAGRSTGDFVTSPETGSLFGALVATALDGWWYELGAPDPFVVVEAGAGRGRLAREVLRAQPACSRALRYVMVERSETLRGHQREVLEPAVAVEPSSEVLGAYAAADDLDDEPHLVVGQGPLVTALDALPSLRVARGVLFANELLDNLGMRIVERTSTGWNEIRVGERDGSFVEVAVPAPEALVVDLASAIAEGARVPVPVGIRSWWEEVGRTLGTGVVAVVDYGAAHVELAARGGWLRTYAGHVRGTDPLLAPGTYDITIDVPTDLVVQAARQHGWNCVRDTSQAEWLTSLGIDRHVAAARTAWDAGRSRGDLAAIMARSVVHEAEALRDPGGLGAFRVLEFRR